MQPQYVAPLSSSNRSVEALESQPVTVARLAYLFHSLSPILSHDCTQAIVTSTKGHAGLLGSVLSINKSRRYRCQRASRAFSRSALSPSWPHVVAITTQKKNLLSLTRNRFRSNRFTLVNTSKLNFGQAFGPVYSPRRFLAMFRISTKLGGAPC